MGIVHDAFLWHLQTEQEDNDRVWQEAHSHYLAVSDLGHCVRKAYLRLRKSQETHPHDDYVLSLMRDGNVYQNDTARALAAWYGDNLLPPDDPALCVCDDKWLGHLDFLVCTSTGDVIVEHKATNPDNFCKRNRLPYPFHCYQLAGYGILRQKMGHPPARLLLYRLYQDRPPRRCASRHLLVTNRRFGGACPLDRKVAGGRVWDLSQCTPAQARH